MKNRIFCGVLLSALLAAALFSSVLMADAEETGKTAEILEEVSLETTVVETAPGETGETVWTEPLQEWEAPEETEPAETAPAAEWEIAVDAQPETVVIPISRIPELSGGMEGISFRGTVVLVLKRELVVQDDTGGIRVALEEELDIAAGDVVLVTGSTGEIFSAGTVKTEGRGTLPAVKTTLSQAPEALRIALEGCSVQGETLRQGADTIALVTSQTVQGTADVCGVILDGRLYADTIVPTVQPNRREWNVYFGLLHGHSTISDGCDTVQEAFSRAEGLEGLDFFALTDHSDSFENGDRGGIALDGRTVSADWAAGKQAAAQVTNENFVGIFGFEMTWGEDKALGHINTFCTPGWQTRDQDGMDTLSGYFGALRKVADSVSQFNHPGNAYGEFRGFREYDPGYDASVQLLEVVGERGTSFFPQYVRALDAGWHVAPTAGGNHHDSDWGNVRTGILARALTEDALYQAMRCRRVYATQDPDLSVEFRLNGQIMGGIIGTAETLEASVYLEDPTDSAGAAVEVLSTGGYVLLSRKLEEAAGEITFLVPAGYPYYFLRITQPDGDVAVTAPVWVDDFTDMGIHSFRGEPETPLQGESVELTLELYNRETVPLEVESVTLLLGGEKVGEFHREAEAYRCSFLWTQPGEVRLTAVVQGTVDGNSRSYRKNLTLHYRSEDVSKADIARVRTGRTGRVFRVSGHATSGNTNLHTTFPDTIYVQDSTGGIPVVGEFLQQIQIGAPLDITGVLREEKGERYLDLICCELPPKTLRRDAPAVMGCKAAMDYERRGGSLIQTEGTVKSLTKTRNGKGISRLILQDSSGDMAVVTVEPEIGSGAYGANRLASQIKVGDMVRAIGLLSKDPEGSAVLRVRNCDEVVSVPPVPDKTNPQTGDALFRELPNRIGSRLRFRFPWKSG